MCFILYLEKQYSGQESKGFCRLPKESVVLTQVKAFA